MEFVDIFFGHNIGFLTVDDDETIRWFCVFPKRESDHSAFRKGEARSEEMMEVQDWVSSFVLPMDFRVRLERTEIGLQKAELQKWPVTM